MLPAPEGLLPPYPSLASQCSGCAGLILRLRVCAQVEGGLIAAGGGDGEGKPCGAVAPDPGYRGWEEAGLWVRRGSKPQLPCIPSSPPLHGPMTHCILVTKHNYKDKIIKNFKKMTAEHSSPSLGPSESGALCTCTGHRPMTPGQHPKPLRTPVSQSTRRFYILVAAISLRDP